MFKYVIEGGHRLQGEVQIKGSKNAALAILAASVLLDSECVINSVPKINDIKCLLEILEELGAEVEWVGEDSVRINPTTINSVEVSDEKASKIRASCYLLGALLGREKQAKVPASGGCNFGTRPIDQHLKGFSMLGADVEDGGIIKLKAEKIVGTSIYLDIVTVGATINIMLAAVKAEGVTTIENAAKEPHVVDLAVFLNAMGAKITGAGTDVIKIKGVSELKGEYKHNVIPDQIEAGTYMVAAAATGGDVLIKNIIPTHMESITAKLIEMGVTVEEFDEEIRVIADKPLQKAMVKTMPHPGFPTDMQPIITVLACHAEGTSKIIENVWESRFQYVDELKRMGAKIEVVGKQAFVEGTRLVGAKVKALDLRAGAGLVIAGMMADGITEVNNIKYVERGYENFDSQLNKLGAKISKVESKADE